MSVKENQLSAENITFFSACRENTGASFLDSGGAYGRQHQLPEIDPSGSGIIWDPRDDAPSLSTPHYLNSLFKIDRDLQKRFEEFCAMDENADKDWFEVSKDFCTEVLKLTQMAKDNSYNNENDLTQVYVWEVWNDGSSDDWIYPDETTVTVFFMHTGCDVRGGYGRPIFCRSKDQFGEYSCPVNPVCEFYLGEVRPAKGETGKPYEEVAECWGAGYTTNPGYELLEKGLDRWLKRKSKDPQARWAKLKGLKGSVLIVAAMPNS